MSESRLPRLPKSPALGEAAKLIPSKEWYLNRPFFQILRRHPEIMQLWSAQECCVSTPFTLVMAQVAAKFKDPGLRWTLFDVVAGELGDKYGRPRELLPRFTVAQMIEALTAFDEGHPIPKPPLPDGSRDHSTAHALLSDELRQALGVPATWVVPLPETRRYLDSMWHLLDENVTAIETLAWFGEAQEAAIEHEYSALADAGAEALHHPNAFAFFNGNIAEDFGHRAKFRRASSALIMAHETPELRRLAGDVYVAASRQAHIDRAVTYYDSLAQSAERWLADPELLNVLGRNQPELVAQYLRWVDPESPAVVDQVLELAKGELERLVALWADDEPAYRYQYGSRPTEPGFNELRLPVPTLDGRSFD